MNPAPPSPTQGAPRVAVLVSSCDGFFDAWRPFARFFERHWPDCPWPVYLVVNRLTVRSDHVRPLAVGRDQGWSDNLRHALGSLEADLLLYFQEDYFLTAPADTARLVAWADACLAGSIDCLCLRALPLPEAQNWPPVAGHEGEWTEVPAASPWRARLQTAFWRPQALRDALRPGKNAWEFERRGSERLREARVLSVTPAGETALPYLASAIVRGLWTPEARRLCAAHGVPLTPRVRGTFSDDPARCKRRRALDRLRAPLALGWQRWGQGGVVTL